MRPLRLARNEAGTRYQLSLYGAEQLRTMLDVAYDNADQIVTFCELVRDELLKRHANQSDPDVGS